MEYVQSVFLEDMSATVIVFNSRSVYPSIRQSAGFGYLSIFVSMSAIRMPSALASTIARYLCSASYFSR